MKNKLYQLMAIVGTFLFWILAFQDRLVAEEGFKINMVVVCENVEDRTPVKPASEFTKEVARLYCFTAVSNPGAPDTITHVWIYDGEEMARVELNVGTSPNWRTWSSKEILPESTGPWKVTVVDPTGVEIGSVDFHIGPPEVSPEEIAEPEEAPEEEAPAPEEEAAPEDTVEQDTTPKL